MLTLYRAGQSKFTRFLSLNMGVRWVGRTRTDFLKLFQIFTALFASFVGHISVFCYVFVIFLCCVFQHFGGSVGLHLVEGVRFGFVCGVSFDGDVFVDGCLGGFPVYRVGSDCPCSAGG